MKNNTPRKTINVDKPNLMTLWTLKQEDNVVLKLALFKEATPFNITGQTIRLGAKTLKGLKEQLDGFTIQENNLDIDLKNTILVPGLVEIDLEFTDVEGKMTSTSFFINVDSKVLNDDAVEATNEFSTFKRTVEEIEKDYQGLRKIVIDENNAANLQDQVNKVNSSLEQKTDKKTTQSLQTQLNNLVLGAVGDGNNAEVIQARGEKSTLNDRIVNIENGELVKVKSIDDSKINKININKLTDDILTTSDFYGNKNSNIIVGDDYICITPNSTKQIGAITKNDLSYLFDNLKLNDEILVEFEYKSNINISFYMSNLTSWDKYFSLASTSSFVKISKKVIPNETFFNSSITKGIFICSGPTVTESDKIEIKNLSIKINKEILPTILTEFKDKIQKETTENIPLCVNGFNLFNDKNKIDTLDESFNVYLSNDNMDSFGTKEENVNNSIYPSNIGFKMSTRGTNSATVTSYYEDTSIVCKFDDLSKSELDNSQKYRMGNILLNNFNNINNVISIIIEYDTNISNFDYYKNNFLFYLQAKYTDGAKTTKKVQFVKENGTIKFEIDLLAKEVSSFNLGVLYSSTLEQLSTTDKAIIKFNKIGVFNNKNNVFSFDRFVYEEEQKTLNNKIENIKILNKEYNYISMFKKIGGIGDSLMSGEHVYQGDSGLVYVDKYDFSWLSFLTQRNNIEPVHYSKGGLTCQKWFEGVYKTNLESEETKCNAYFIGLCTNDYGKLPYELGDINDVTGTNTFVGWYKKIIEFVHSIAPNSKIFVMSGYTFSDVSIRYSNMLKQISNLYDYCYYIDLINKSDILLKRDTEFESNGHFNTPGYIRLSKNIEKITNEVIAENISDFSMFALNY